MHEVGIDLTREAPTKLTDEMAQRSDVIVTMGCGDDCPYFPWKRYVDWDLNDRTGMGIETVRKIRDDTEERVRRLVDELISVS